jgi:hypothetical protein
VTLSAKAPDPPNKVVMMLVAAITFRTRAFPESLMNRFELVSPVIYLKLEKTAREKGPPSPLNPQLFVVPPAVVTMLVLRSIFRIRQLPESVTYIYEPMESPQIATGLKNEALLTGMPSPTSNDPLTVVTMLLDEIMRSRRKGRSA